MKTLATFVHRFPRWIISATFLITLGMIPGISKIKTAGGPEHEFTIVDRMVQDVVSIKKSFGGSVRTSVIAIQAENNRRVIEQDVLELIRDLSKDVADVGAVRKGGVLSLATVVDFVSTDQGLESIPFLKEIPQNFAEEEAFSKKVEFNDLIHGRLVSKDFKTSIIAANIIDGKNLSEIHAQMSVLVEKYKAKATRGIRVSLAGTPEIDYRLETRALSETKIFMGIALLLLLASFYFVFKTWRGVLIPFASSSIGIIWTMGLMGYYGHPIEIISALLPVLLVVTGSEYAIYMFLHLKEELHEGTSFRNGLHRLLKKIFMPLFGSAMSTFIGGVTLITFPLEMIQHFGLFFGIGTLFLFVLSVVVIPALYVAFGGHISRVEQRLQRGIGSLREAAQKTVHAIPVAGEMTETLAETVAESVMGGVEGFKKGFEKAHLIDRILAMLARWVNTHPYRIIVITLMVGVLAVFQAEKLIISFDNLSMLPKGEPIRKVTEQLNEAFHGIQSFDVVFASPKEGAVLEPEFLKKLEQVQKRFNEHPKISHTFSMNDILKKVDGVLTPEHGKGMLPETAEAASQYLLLLSFSGEGSSALQNLITTQQNQTKLTVTTLVNDTKAFEVLYRDLKRTSEEVMGDQIRVQFGGSPMLWIAMMKVIILGKLQNIISSLLLIIILIVVTTRSVTRAFYTVSTLPIGIALNFGVMGAMGIRLDIVTAIITSFGMGMGVDFAIHFISAVKLEYELDRNLDGAIHRSILTSGKALVLSAVTNVIGLSALLFSRFSAIRTFSILMCFILVTLAILSVVMLPALMRIFPPEFITQSRRRTGSKQSKRRASFKYGMGVVACLVMLAAVAYIETLF